MRKRKRKKKEADRDRKRGEEKEREREMKLKITSRAFFTRKELEVIQVRALNQNTNLRIEGLGLVQE